LGCNPAENAPMAAGGTKSWWHRVFGRQTWQEALQAGSSPVKICRLVGRHVAYRHGSSDGWCRGEAVWSRKWADCAGFASCVWEMCRSAGVDAAVRLYYSTGCPGLGHAVVVGRSGATTWISSNGCYERFEDDAEALVWVARQMSWSVPQTWCRPLEDEEVRALIAKGSHEVRGNHKA